MTSSLSSEERGFLLRLARQAIESSLQGTELKTGSRFSEHRGAFVTLRLRSNESLRGCIGYAEPLYPLAEAVVRSARAAALEDRRFEPLSRAELSSIRIEISVLSPLRKVSPDAVRVGTDGLVIEKGGRRGLLLPQVAPEWGWDRDTFLEQTCKKAGLPGSAWRQGAEIFAFQAEVFGEDA
jgi:AmmeMemoRadiSam system protein A